MTIVVSIGVMKHSENNHNHVLTTIHHVVKVVIASATYRVARSVELLRQLVGNHLRTNCMHVCTVVMVLVNLVYRANNRPRYVPSVMINARTLRRHSPFVPHLHVWYNSAFRSRVLYLRRRLRRIHSLE